MAGVKKEYLQGILKRNGLFIPNLDKPELIQILLEKAVTDYLDGREFKKGGSENSVTYLSVRRSEPESKNDKSGK